MAKHPDLHPEERTLIDHMEKELGADRVSTAPTHELSGSMVDDTGVIVVTMNAGDPKEAEEAAYTCNDAAVRNSEIKFMFGVNGLKDDPREIDQIDSGRLSLRTLFTHLTQKAFHRFDIEHQALMLVAMGLGERKGTQLHVPPWMVKDPCHD